LSELCQKSRRCGLQSAGSKILAQQEWFQTDIWFCCAKKAGAVGCNPQEQKFWHGKSGFRQISGFTVPKKPALWAAIRRIENFGTARVISDSYLVVLCQKSRFCGLKSELHPKTRTQCFYLCGMFSVFDR
jgi:hypothetical protein